MSLRSARPLRWLRLAVALLVLFSGEGLHGLVHDRVAGSRHASASGEIEVHAGDCQHRQGVHELHVHACLLCKAGTLHQALPQAAPGPHAIAPPPGPAFALDGVRIPHTCPPGILGARAPPTLTA